MTQIESDDRTPERRARDEQTAAEPKLSPLEIPPGTKPLKVEDHLGRRRRQPLALAGVVENGVVRFLDPSAKLPEHSRVIVVAESA